MKVESDLLVSLHLDDGYSLLSVKDVALLLEYFKALDIRGNLGLDGIYNIHFTNSIMEWILFLDIQFFAFLKSSTDLNHDQIYAVFDMLDVNHSGLIDFDEFYLLACILIAVKVKFLFIILKNTNSLG